MTATGEGMPGEHYVSSAAERGPLVMEALSLNKDFRLRHGGGVVHAVKDVSFGLYASAVVALVGESGSGKSTVAKCLAGQERLSSGNVRLRNQPVKLATRRAFRRYKREVQYVFQDPFASLNPVHTVQYTLAQPVKLHQGLRSKAEVRSAVIDLLEQVHLTPGEQFLAKYPHELSGGQRQRVSFARALAARPTVLLADEPVSMLDVSIRLEMLNLLSELCQSLQLALLYITHDIASARYFADEVLVMYAGEVVERGPAEALTQEPAHPYTQLLMACSPDPDNLGSTLRRGAERARHDAEPRSNSGVNGCLFSARCPFADERCREEHPLPTTISATRAASCWRLGPVPGSLSSSPVTAPRDASVDC